MEIVRCSVDNLASVLMGKEVYLPWRGQRNVIITIPYDEWYKFVSKYSDLLSNRAPLDYRRILDEDVPNRKHKFFIFDVTWALFNEIMYSQNAGHDATIILPEFDVDETRTIDDIMKNANAMSTELFNKHYGRLQRAKPRTAERFISNFSPWNWSMLRLCVYLHSLPFDGDMTKFNIEWR